MIYHIGLCTSSARLIFPSGEHVEILAVGNINITIPGFFGPWSLKKMRDLQLKWPFLKVENGGFTQCEKQKFHEENGKTSFESKVFSMGELLLKNLDGSSTHPSDIMRVNSDRLNIPELLGQVQNMCTRQSYLRIP